MPKWQAKFFSESLWHVSFLFSTVQILFLSSIMFSKIVHAPLGEGLKTVKAKAKFSQSKHSDFNNGWEKI